MQTLEVDCAVSDAACARPVLAQELVCSADQDGEAGAAFRSALEQALDAPAAAHPVEGYGPDNMSLAQALPPAGPPLPWLCAASPHLS